MDQRTAQEPAKAAESHYSTPEHRAWRTVVIAQSNGRCQVCHRSGARLFADHVVELRDGGAATDPANGQALCGACHTAKTHRARADRQARRYAPGA
jgi:5-methylcytosine-specific restriction enzyme A